MGGDPRAKLEMAGFGQGVLFLDMVSLMPQQTWKDYELRTDLAAALNQPMKVSPRTEPLQFRGTSLTRCFPGNSLTGLRLVTRAD